jgi:endo-1,4-beta-xylanase
MKHRLFLALVVLVWVPFLIMFRVSSTASVPAVSPASAADTSGTSLRSLAQKRGIGIGAAVELAPFYNDSNYRKVLAREFNILVPENDLKFELLHPIRAGYNFSQVDPLFAFAKAHNMRVRGSPLVWHYSLPRWLEEGQFTRDQWLAILREYIQTVVGRYRGQVIAWDVLNEAVNRDGSLRDTLWLRHIGPEYIDLAFRWAHEADPQARLFYSDYAAEDLGQKSNAIYTLVTGLVQRGVPINGVGFQTHIILTDPLLLEARAKNINRLGELGLEVQFTEVDVRIQDRTRRREDLFAEQARIYGDIFQLCQRAQNCTAFITWGFTDRYSWAEGLTGQPEFPLLFDESYHPKPAYNTIKESLSKGQERNENSGR